jgi:dTDP-4-dehydrorhamnose reductase
MNNRVLITGGSGLLALNWAYEKRYVNLIILGLHNRQVAIPGALAKKVNLESMEELQRQIEEIQPGLIIHAAGLTSVEKCESDPELAIYSNVVISRNLANICARLKVPFTLISTDHLFSGKTSFMNESSPAEPVNMYGKSKLESEASVLKENENALIIRTNFYGWGTSYRQSFSDYIIKALRAKREIKLFQDVYYTPILAKYLINSVHKLVDMKSNGIFNIVGDTRLSKFEFGVKLAKEFGLDHALIKPINFQANQNALARRPLDMSLSNKKVSDLIGHTMGTADEHLHELHRQEGYGMATELGVL